MAYQTSILAGGCFWCTESALAKLHGLISIKPGYIGGQTANPSYEAVCGGATGHYEAVKIIFDAELISYKYLLDRFIKDTDPTDAYGQFADKGSQYRPAIFVLDTTQERIARDTLKELNEAKIFPKPIVMQIIDCSDQTLAQNIFYEAEEYHHEYYKRNPTHYQQYRIGSGRAAFTDQYWAVLQKSLGFSPLTELQCHVTQGCGTEPPFNNKYWDHKEQGIYVDIITGQPLFSSKDKFDSATGWPSFTQPIHEDAIEVHPDQSHAMTRIEVKSSIGKNHLGHVFPDGPLPTGLRYCINSAALRFVAD